MFTVLRSSTVLKYLGQYGFLVGAIAWLGNSAYFGFLGLWTGDWSTHEIIAPGIAGLIHLSAFLYLGNKFVVVELSGRTVKILKGKQTIETTWDNVESVERVIFSSPPIYTIRIKEVKGYFIFWNSAINILWFDHSDLGELISQKKKRFDI